MLRENCLSMFGEWLHMSKINLPVRRSFSGMRAYNDDQKAISPKKYRKRGKSKQIDKWRLCDAKISIKYVSVTESIVCRTFISFRFWEREKCAENIAELANVLWFSFFHSYFMKHFAVT